MLKGQAKNITQTLVLPIRLREKLFELSQATGVPMSRIVSTALEEKFQREDKGTRLENESRR